MVDFFQFVKVRHYFAFVDKIVFLNLDSLGHKVSCLEVAIPNCDLEGFVSVELHIDTHTFKHSIQVSNILKLHEWFALVHNINTKNMIQWVKTLSVVDINKSDRAGQRVCIPPIAQQMFLNNTAPIFFIINYPNAP